MWSEGGVADQTKGDSDWYWMTQIQGAAKKRKTTSGWQDMKAWGIITIGVIYFVSLTYKFISFTIQWQINKV
jgi:hypothetical protein